MHEPVSPIMLALVLRQIMPSLNIAQVPTVEMWQGDGARDVMGC